LRLVPEHYGGPHGRHHGRDAGHGRAHAIGQAAEDHGRRAGARLLGEVLHRLVVVGGVVLADATDGQAGDQAGQDGAEEVERLGDLLHRAEHHPGQHGGGHGGQHGGDVGAAVQRRAERPAGLGADEEGTDDRGHHAGGGDHQREDDAGERVGGVSEDHRAEHDRRHDGAHVGLEQVGAHAGHVADVVADVVGDGGGVARIVLGDARLDLAHQIGADIGRLRVDAAPDTGKQRDRRCSEAERGNHLEGAVHLEPFREDEVGAGNAQQSQTGNREAHHRAAAKGDRQRDRGARTRRMSGTGVGGCRYPHTGETGRSREDRAEQVRERPPRPSVVENDEDDEAHGDHEHRDRSVLATQERHGPLSDRGREILHDVGALVGFLDLVREIEGQSESRERGENRQIRDSFHMQRRNLAFAAPRGQIRSVQPDDEGGGSSFVLLRFLGPPCRHGALVHEAFEQGA
jgi:hypothetical protein